MTHPAPGWSPPSTALVAAGATPGGPEGLADFANWGEGDWNSFLNAKFAAWLDKYNVPFDYLNELTSSIVLAFQGDPGPLEDLIEDAVREIPIVGDILADLWDAIRGEYEGDHPILLAIQGLFAPLRRVVQIFTGRPGGLGAEPAEVESFWDDMRATLKGEETSGTWFEDVSIAAASGVATLAENIQNAVSGGVAAGAGAIAGAFDAVADLFGLADAAQKIAMAAQQQIQDLQNETSNPDFNGFAWSTIFSGADGVPLSSGDWSGSAEIVIRGDSGYAGVAEGSPNAVYFKCSSYEFASDTQSASMVLGTRTGDDLWSSVCVRCNPSMTEGAFCRFNRSTIQIGRFTRSGATWTPVVWTSVSRTQNQGDIIRFRCSGDNYYVLVNGVTIISWTDSGASVSTGTGFRRAGFTQLKDTNFFGFNIASWRIASFAMADWLPPGGAVTTPAWRLRRGAGSEIALAVAHGAQAQMPASFYTVNDLASSVTVTNLGTGQVTITESGWYELVATSTNVDKTDASPAFGNQTNLENAWRPTLWVLFVDGIAVAGPIMAGVSVTVYLSAGQSVRPGVSASWPFTLSAAGEDSAFHSMSRSNISHVGGAPSASFTGRKVAA